MIFSYDVAYIAYIHADLEMNQIKLIKKLDFSHNEITIMTIDSKKENIIGFNNKFVSLNYNLASSKKTVQMSEY